MFALVLVDRALAALADEPAPYHVEDTTAIRTAQREKLRTRVPPSRQRGDHNENGQGVAKKRKDDLAHEADAHVGSFFANQDFPGHASQGLQQERDMV